MILEVVFWLAVFILFFTYIGYPALLAFLAGKREINTVCFKNADELPDISVLMAVHNEEQVIQKKLENLENLSYPPGKMEILIGSDASTDGTDRLLKLWTLEKERRVFKRFKNRSGKGTIINTLAEEANGEILVITDANVFAGTGSLEKLARHYKNRNIGLVDSAMEHHGIQKEGISFQEHAYISREVRIKTREAKIWGCMMGPAGGFYSLRRDLFKPIPEKFLVDDFYINMNVLLNGSQTIIEPDATVFEDVSNVLGEEFKRKVRIAAGSFQNLKMFSNLLLKPFSPLGFCFISHKVLRWMGPAFILAALASNIFLTANRLYLITLIIQLMLIGIPFIDLFIRKINIHIVILRFITHFYSMNLAILVGFGWFVKGIRTNVWEPTKRNQS